MKHLVKFLKYLVCVVIAGLMFIPFLLIDDTHVLTETILVPIIISFGIGWGIYQYGVNKIHEKGMNYYYMLIKLTTQCVTIMGVLFFMAIKLGMVK